MAYGWEFGISSMNGVGPRLLTVYDGGCLANRVKMGSRFRGNDGVEKRGMGAQEEEKE